MIAQLRQGDILFELVERKDHAFLQLNQDGIVAYGEISGHQHVIQGDGELYVRPAQQRGYNEEDNRIGYIIAEADCIVVHDEHATVPLAKGIYKVSQQREHVRENKDLKRYQPPEVKRVQD